MKALMLRTFLMLSVGLSAAQAPAAERSPHETYRDRFNEILGRAARSIPAGDRGDNDRRAISCALAKNGHDKASVSLIVNITGPRPRMLAWSCLGRAQGKFGKNQLGAKTSFEKAVQAAMQMQGSASDVASALEGIALDRAESGDLNGAIQVTQLVSESYRFRALMRMARFAARKGDPSIAESLLSQVRNEDDLSQLQTLISIGHANAGNAAPALAAFEKILKPEHAVSALLALHESEILSEDLQVQLLPLALSLVPQVPEAEVMDFSGTIRDHLYAAIARAQLENEDEAQAIAASMKTLARIEKGINALESVVRISRIFTDEGHVKEALEIAARPSMDPLTRLAVYGAILETLGDARKAASDPEELTSLAADEGRVISLAAKIPEELTGSDKAWANASLVEAQARSRDFEMAWKSALRLKDSPRQQAYAFRSIALAAIEKEEPDYVGKSLDKMVEFASNSPDTSNILAQCMLSMLEYLLDDQPVSFPAAMSGLY